jgi:hypothetical protein
MENKFYPIKMIITMMIVMTGCATILDMKKDTAILEDIADDVIKEETGVDIRQMQQNKANGG